MSTPRVEPLPVEQWKAGLLDKAKSITGQGIRASGNVYCTLANTPRLLPPWLSMGAHLLRSSSLSPRQRELIILRTTALVGASYPFTQHVRIGGEHGLGTDAVSAVHNGPQDPFWSADERALLNVVDELIAGGSIGDASWNALRARASTPQILDCIVTVAFYRLASWLLNLCRTPLDPDQVPRLGPVVGARSPGQSAYDGDVRLPSLAPEQWPGWLFEETAGWPRFAGRPELRQAGVYGTLANHPALFAALGPVMAHLLVDISLSEQQRELVIIRSCARDRGAYPYRQHVSIGRRLGLTDNTLTALANADAAMLEPSDQALVTLVDSLHRDGGLTDANWTQARAHFSVEQLFDATVTAGFYGVISFVLSSARTPLEPGTIELPRFASAR